MAHGAAVVLDPHRVGSGLPRRAVASAGVYPRSFQPGTLGHLPLTINSTLCSADFPLTSPRRRCAGAVRVVARCPGGRRGVPRRVRARRRRVGYGSPACARRCSLLPRPTTGALDFGGN